MVPLLYLQQMMSFTVVRCIKRSHMLGISHHITLMIPRPCPLFGACLRKSTPQWDAKLLLILYVPKETMTLLLECYT